MTTLIIDSSYLIYRSYFAHPDLSHKNFPTGALFGYIKAVLTLIQDYKPSQIIFAEDLPKPTWRHKILDSYKAGRPEPDDKMIRQIPIIQNWCRQISDQTFAVEEFEADDIIFTASLQLSTFKPNRKDLIKKNTAKARENLFTEEKPAEIITNLEQLLAQSKLSDNQIFIFSSDRDLYQLLIFPNIKFIKSKFSGQFEIFGDKEFTEKYQLKPSQWLDFKALVGDTSDNLKGIDGVGPKTAVKILQAVGSLYNLFEIINLNKIPFFRSHSLLTETQITNAESWIKNEKNSKLISKLRNSFVQIEATYKLSSLHLVPNLPLTGKGPDLNSGMPTLEKYNLTSLKKQVQKLATAAEIQESLF